MKSPLFPALLLGLLLIGCERSDAPPAAVTPPAPPSPPADDSGLREARDALARQAMDIETRSALLDKQLAELEARLQQSENETLRGQLDQLKQQNDQLRTQADSARKQSDALTQHLTASAPAPAPGLTPPTTPRDLSLFYERLAPHGRWIDVSGHGLCFQPRMARNRTWRPYVDGCWNWSSLGWTWQTSEPFGWATYHYGRWVNLTTHGWLWVPGCEWAPAWVAWRQSRDHIGWAPLPPESSACDTIRRDCDTRYGLGPASYTFVRTTHFVRPSYTTCIQPVSYNSTIFQHTVNVTQIVPCGDRHSPTPIYMHHGGPPRQHIEQTCHQPVPQTQIRPIEPAQITLKPGPLDTSKGVTPIVGIIQLPAAAENKVPAIQPSERIERPILANSFAGVPVEARTGIQQTLAAEARQFQLTDSPRPIVLKPTPQVSGPLAETTPGAAAIPSEQPANGPALPNKLSALPETRGSPPEITQPTLPSVQPEQPQPVALAPRASSDPSESSASTPPSSAIATVPAGEPAAAPSAPITVPVTLPPTEGAAPAITDQPAPMAATQPPPAEDTARRAAEEESARQVQMQAQQQAAAAEHQAQEAAQQQAHMEAQRQAEEAARRAADEAQRQAQMEAQKQAEEAARRAADEAQRQAQMEAQRQAEEAARRAAEEAQRQAQMEAQRQAEEAARRAAEEAQRQAQMEAQRQAEEAARRAAEEAARRAAEEAARQAAQQPTPPPQ